MPMTLSALSIAGAFAADTNSVADHRGSFARLFCAAELAQAFGSRPVAQINLSCTRSRGAIRGMHFQRAPHAEMKLVRCLKGRVWDVLVDLRAGSQTFLRWHAEELSEQNRRMLVIPEGCAHGFQALEPDSELLYLHTAAYRPDAEGGVRFDDPRLAITWPLPAADLSERDRGHPALTDDFRGLTP
jgi:dTDP-4-dehydrorhamnose 3,5-epimerase